MRKLLSVLLSVLLILSVLSIAGAEGEEKIFRVGEQLALFEKDGLSVSLAGGVVMLDMSQTFPAPVDIRDANASVALTAVVENRTDKDLFIEYSGTVNGISLGDRRPLVNVHKLTAGSRNAVYIAFQKEWLNGADISILQNCDLTFHVYEKPTNLNDDNVLLYEIPAGVVRFDQAPVAGLSFREGESLVILAQNGLQISVSTIQVSKGSQYLIMGAKVLNNTGKTINIGYASKINGWDIGGYRGTPMGTDGKSMESIASGTSAELIMPVTLYGWNKIRAVAELESLELIFGVKEVDGSGNKTLWFTAPTGTIWINRAAGTGFVETAAPVVVAEAPTATPEPPAQKEFTLMFGLAFGDDNNTVKNKAKEAGASLYSESGALHGNADLFDLPNKSYDYLFTDSGKLNCIRNLSQMDEGTKTSTAEAVYQRALAQLEEYFGEPNGRGSTEEKRSVTDQFTEVAKSIISGPYHVYLQHDEWYIADAKPYPLKIDLFFEDAGNREAGSQAYTVEINIEARGVK